jgi:hypothetical protein
VKEKEPTHKKKLPDTIKYADGTEVEIHWETERERMKRISDERYEELKRKREERETLDK